MQQDNGSDGGADQEETEQLQLDSGNREILEAKNRVPEQNQGNQSDLAVSIPVNADGMKVSSGIHTDNTLSKDLTQHKTKDTYLTYDEMQLLNYTSGSGVHLPFTTLMQQMINSTESNYPKTQDGLGACVDFLNAPVGFQNSMIMASSRINDDYSGAQIGHTDYCQDMHVDIEDETPHYWSLDMLKSMENSNGSGENDEAGNEPTFHTNSEAHHQEDLRIDVNETAQNRLLNEDDIENFLILEEQAAKQGNNVQVDSKYTHAMGMQFKIAEEAHHFFNFYAFLSGFSVVLTHTYHSTGKKRDDGVTRVTYKCNRHGVTKKQKQEKVTTERDTNILIKTNCECVMVVTKTNGIWYITRLDLDHNHDLSPNSETRFMRSHKYMTPEEKGLIRTLKECNIPTRSMISILSFLRGSLTALPYTKKDVSNLRTSINRETTTNDMVQVLEYFSKKQKDDPRFYYAFDLDENKKVRNMFWTNGRSREYYAQYGDCVSFDTTYQTNRYNLPFAPFVGITGHGNTCIFGCAFILDETVDTFKWLFTTFLSAMGGQEPMTIITDQDGAMRSAISQIFPNTTHRNCLFHILKKAVEKGGKCFSRNHELFEDFQDITHNCVTIDEFEKLWQEMIEKYQIQNIKYFQQMWLTRERFVPVYFKHNFCPFIESTALSEGTNARFKRNVGPQCSVTSFLKEYDRLIDTIFTAEEKDNHECRSREPKQLWSEYYIEEQAMQLYNRNIFKKFQKQLKDTARLQLTELEPSKVYEVFQAFNYRKKEWRLRKYIVLVDLPREDLSCICGKFQKDGILCSHILRVILYLDLTKIPDKYIIDRWRKKTNEVVRINAMNTDAENSTLRFNVLSRRFADLASKGSKSGATYNYLMEEISRIENHLNIVAADKELHEQSHGQSNSDKNANDVAADESSAVRQINLVDPDVAQTKGRPSTRFKSLIERIKEKEIYHCSHCGNTDHNFATCKLKHIEIELPKKKRQNMNEANKQGGQSKKKAREHATLKEM